MNLLERDASLATLEADFQAATAGAGRTVLVSGEAGVGKTSLVERFAATHDGARVLWGACEALSTPHPLGPLHDIARVRPRLKALLASGEDRARLFDAVIDELDGSGAPTILVIEDVHWADAGTLDLVRFLARRISRLHALLVLTYREDEPAGPALLTLLGTLPARHVTRIALACLSPAGTRELADRAMRNVPRLHDLTGGNPFFLTEVLARSGVDVPSSVRDAVLGRALPLGPSAREVLDLAAIVPRAIELALIEAVLGPAVAAIEDCVHRGLLRTEGETLRFRHELARVAVEGAILAPRARHLHGRVFAALSRGAVPAPLARRLHHAHKAGDIDAVLTLSPGAAREAAERGALREAVQHCRIALEHADRLADGDRAALLDACAGYSYELNDLATALPMRAQAIAIYERSGDARRACLALAAHAIAQVRALHNADADATSRRALAIAGALPSGPELARAHVTEAYLRMLNRDYADAMRHGDVAIAMARGPAGRAIVASAHSYRSAALIFVDYDRGLAALRESVALSRDLRDGGLAVAEAHLLLGAAAGELYRFDEAEHELAEGIEFARSRDLDRMAGYMEAWQALCDMYRGRWDLAGKRGEHAIARDRAESTNRVMALIALGRLRTRRGDHGAVELLDEALLLAERAGTLLRAAPARAARAEAAWLAGDVEGTAREAAASYELALAEAAPVVHRRARLLAEEGRQADGGARARGSALRAPDAGPA